MTSSVITASNRSGADSTYTRSGTASRSDVSRMPRVKGSMRPSDSHSARQRRRSASTRPVCSGRHVGERAYRDRRWRGRLALVRQARRDPSSGEPDVAGVIGPTVAAEDVAPISVRRGSVTVVTARARRRLSRQFKRTFGHSHVEEAHQLRRVFGLMLATNADGRGFE
jgi:hypothetical protein